MTTPTDRLRRLGLLLAVAALGLSTPAAAEGARPAGEAQQSPAPTERQLLLVDEAARVVAEVGDRLWPGWRSAPKTTLIIAGDFEFLLNYPRRTAAPSGFRSTGRTYNRAAIWRRDASLPDTLRTAFPVAGIPAAVVGAWEPAVESPDEWVVTLVEQWFHVLQMHRGESDKVLDLELAESDRPSWQVDYPFPYEDPDVGNAMLLLGQTLYEFWSRSGNLPREGQRELLARNAWAALQNLRTVVRLKYGEQAYRYFQLESWRDGVARYSGILVAREIARAEYNDEYEQGSGFTGLPERKSYVRLWEENFKNRFWLIRTSGLEGERDATSFDAIGHGIAELLDSIHPDWKERYFDRGVWLDDLIEERLGPNPFGGP